MRTYVRSLYYRFDHRCERALSMIDWRLLAWSLSLANFVWATIFAVSAYAQTSAPISIDVQPPPQKYDYPYKGDTAIVYDLDPAYRMWAWTDVSQVKRGACTIHLVPFGTVDNGEVLDEYAKTRIFRHENAHCNGWRHR